LGWYVLASLLAAVTLSPLALLANLAGVYLGWTTTQRLRQPEDVLAEVDELSASSGDAGAGVPGARLRNSGLVGGAILGGVLGLVGAIVFAWVSVQTRTVYGLLVLLPAVAAGLGVGLAVGDRGGTVSGLLAAGGGLLSVGIGFRLLSAWMPPFYELQPDLLLAVVPLVGLALAYKLGTGLAVGTQADDAADVTGGPSAGDGSDSRTQ
jgi:hypothetical protein